MTIGIKPTFASTGYGYISYENLPIMTSPCAVYDVAEFVEKPNFQKAQSYLASGHYLWNSGIFIWKTSVIIEKLQTLFTQTVQIDAAAKHYFGTEQEQKRLRPFTLLYRIFRSIMGFSSVVMRLLWLLEILVGTISELGCAWRYLPSMDGQYRQSQSSWN